MDPNMKRGETFLWHDYETFGASPMVDRPAQFAAQRTDMDLQETGEPVVVFCAPADDVLPHPAACLITGITPQIARDKGVCETEFAGRVLQEMSQPGTCSVGFNSVRFDDLVSRTLFYRNLRDPYEREYKNGNSRWDIIDLARMCYALRPDGVTWPMVDLKPDGQAGSAEPAGQRPSFRLEDLCAANGIAHEGAHDALADVRATIDLARLLRKAQPRLFDWALTMRRHKDVWPMLDPTDPKPLLHTSSRIPAQRGCTTLILPLAVSPGNPKAVIVVDLMADPGPLIEFGADLISDLVFTPTSDLPPDMERIPLKQVRSNGVPMLAPLGTLRSADPDRIGLDPERCLAHARTLLDHLEQVRPKVCEVFADRFSDSADDDGSGDESAGDPDLMLYSGDFFSSGDRHLMNKIVAMDGEDLVGHLWSFQDRRLPTMLLRYRARNYPETLNSSEREAWRRYRQQRLTRPADDRQLDYRQFKEALAHARNEHGANPEANRILDQLEAWAIEIGADELAA
jgi:exodeoxyribonuclease-1